MSNLLSLENVLQAIILVGSVVGAVLIIDKRRVGFVIAAMTEGPWLWYALLIDSWATVCLAILWFIMNTAGAVRWTGPWFRRQVTVYEL